MRLLSVITWTCVITLSSVSGVLADTIELEPLQLVRSFQRVQDAIASGDEAAIDMQRELYQIVREELSSPEGREKYDDRNLRAILSFSIAGGGAEVTYVHRKAFNEYPELLKVANKVRRYNGQNASSLFAELEPEKVGGILGASIALVRAQAGEDSGIRISDLDYVRMQLPGTLFEESALRALLTIHRDATDSSKFLRVASRYARTFGSSPYAAKFADEIVKASIQLDTDEFRSHIAGILSFLPPSRRDELRDRIKRAATVVGKKDLFFSVEDNEAKPKKAEQRLTNSADDIVLRAYNSIEELDAETAGELLSSVEAIIPADLQPENRRLLGVVISLLRAITSEPDVPGVPMAEPAVLPQQMMPDGESGEEVMVADDNADSDAGDLDLFVEQMKSKIGGADELLENIK